MKKDKKDKSARKTGKPPNPGERKAFRKRVSISNVSALEVEGLPFWHKGNLQDDALIGSVVAFPPPLIEKLTALGAFKPGQSWGYFRRQAVLVRREAMDIVKILPSVSESKGTFKGLISGERGTGKSTILAHVMAAALTKGWIVISVPQCNDLVLNNSAYNPIPDTEPTEYYQKHHMASLCRQIHAVNEEVLDKYQVSQAHDLTIPVTPDMTLSRLAFLGGQDPEVSWPVFKALWLELTREPKGDEGTLPPILISIDAIGSLMQKTELRDAKFNYIHAHDLALPKHLLAYLSGGKSLPNGGVVLGATSASMKALNPTLDIALQMAEIRTAKVDLPMPEFSPFLTYDQRVLDILSDVSVRKLGGLSMEMVRSLLEYYHASGLIQEVNDDVVAEKWTMAGGGIVKELEKSTLHLRG
ncbi:MAG: 37S ribosomal protein S23 mitochondrial [Vezdaea aestivalis]|nr:MAG: 37S ribosomal protein S23 mitochondrial [Vezdaea aestivalis]